MSNIHLKTIARWFQFFFQNVYLSYNAGKKNVNNFNTTLVNSQKSYDFKHKSLFQFTILLRVSPIRLHCLLAALSDRDMLLTFKEASALWIKHSESVNLPAHFNCVCGLSLSCCSYPYWRVWQIVLLANLSAKKFRFFSFSFDFLFIFFAPNVSPFIVVSLFQIVFFLNFLDTLFAAFCSVLIFIAVFLRFINFVACYRSGASPSHFQMIVLMVTENKTTKLNLTSELPGDIDN